MTLRNFLSVIPLALTLSACSYLIDADNPFSGCYDNSCVDRPQRVPTVPALASISTKTTHVCGLTAAGEAWCWGNNSYGQLGDGTSQPRSGPVRVTGDTRYSAISLGRDFTCALSLDGTAYCWGSGALGQPASDTCVVFGSSEPCTTAPRALAGRTFVSIAAGVRHACAVDLSGGAWCWGFNYRGETGSSAYGTLVAEPTAVAGSANYASIGAGDSFSCALTTAGRAECWGSAWRGELGRVVAACVTTYVGGEPCTPVPGPASTSANFSSLSVGTGHVCGLTAAGTSICWGDNNQAQLGRPGFGTGLPGLAHDGMTFTVISASGGVTCGTPSTGPSACWGVNFMGKLGVGSRLDLTTTPLAIFGNPRYRAIAGGDMHVCALDEEGAAYCWGSGRNGELGTGEQLP